MATTTKPPAKPPEGAKGAATKPAKPLLTLPTQFIEPKIQIGQYNWLIYGPPKVGKTSFANQFPNALILTTGSGEEPKHIRARWMRVENIEQVIEVGKLLSAGGHDYKTVVIDTLDGLVEMCQDKVIEEHKGQKLALIDGGYGAGYRYANEKLMKILEAFNRTLDSVVLISHSEDRDMQQNGVKFNKTTASLSDSTRKIIMKWVDVIGYCRYLNDDQDTRLITFKGNDCLDAGARTPNSKLPETMALDYNLVRQYFEAPPQPQQQQIQLPPAKQ